MGVKARRTWNEAVVRYVRLKSSKASISAIQSHLRWMDSMLNGKYLDEITAELVERMTESRSKPYSILRKKGPPRHIVPRPATVNRTLEVLRAILHKARDDWHWVDRCPKIEMVELGEPRVRWITREQADALIRHLPKHQAAMVRFALETGLRRSNVTHLEWSTRSACQRDDFPTEKKSGPVTFATGPSIFWRARQDSNPRPLGS